ncbi:MAG: hypothetical protein RBR20_01175 [Desulfobacterales bacterium]|jgi:hypothetical protein|nr:hypothetical protein [Desulfobacteraceae bacterium]MDD3992919.1 hypothetical protein [Desulfobacteraceae bacterium]MDY0310711.1 hypothetical protein [Desulfobacterales bacterium]
MKLLILIAIGAALAFWWRKRSSRPSPPPVEEAYICHTCNETDCTCEKKPETRTGDSHE